MHFVMKFHTLDYEIYKHTRLKLFRIPSFSKVSVKLSTKLFTQLQNYILNNKTTSQVLNFIPRTQVLNFIPRTQVLNLILRYQTSY
jgi:hypothetical protein